MNRPMHPSNAYLRLAEGPEDLIGSQLSLTRRLLTFFVALVMFSGPRCSPRPRWTSTMD
jgi:hypothetical protein